jgi:hypothetical protein
MVSGRTSDPSQDQRVIELMESGLKMKEICEVIKIHPATVHRIVKRLFPGITYNQLQKRMLTQKIIQQKNRELEFINKFNIKVDQLHEMLFTIGKRLFCVERMLQDMRIKLNVKKK